MTEATQLIERAVSADQSWLRGLDATILLTVTGAPDGDVETLWSISDGSLAEGSTIAPDVEVTVAYKDAVAIQQGKLHPTVAYMQGKLKPSGDMKVVLALLERASTQHFDSWLGALRP